MGVLALLAEARAAGLEVTARGDKLVVRGPKSAEPLAKRLLAHKPEVLAALTPAKPCDNCGCPIFHETASGNRRCNLCFDRPEGSRLWLVVHGADGAMRWADYDTERGEHLRRQARGERT